MSQVSGYLRAAHTAFLTSTPLSDRLKLQYLASEMEKANRVPPVTFSDQFFFKIFLSAKSKVNSQCFVTAWLPTRKRLQVKSGVHCTLLSLSLQFDFFSQGLLCRYLGIITERKMFEQGSWFNQILFDPTQVIIILSSIPCSPKIQVLIMSSCMRQAANSLLLQ